MATYTTVIRLSENLTSNESSLIEERIGLHDSTTEILIEDGQATVNIEAESHQEAQGFAEAIVTSVQEIDHEAEIEMLALNDGIEVEDDDDYEADDDDEGDDDDDDDWDDETDY